MKNIPIVYITDDNYTMPTIVSVTSLLKNKKEDYKIYIIGVGLSQNNKKNLENLGIEKVLDLEKKYENLETIKTYVSKAAFFKFDLAEIFNEFDKILYIDSDTVIKDDIKTLLDTDVEGVYGGVVKDCIGEIIHNDTKRLSVKNYFNSGVMLLNLAKMREDNIKEKLLNAKKTAPVDYLDQEIFNIVFKDNVKFLNPEFNYMVTNKKLMKKTVEKFYGVKKINPKIIHLTYLKPWEYKGIAYSREWMKYYNLSPFKDEKLNLKENPDKFRLYKKEKYNDRWVIDILGLRISYKKGGKNFRLFYP